jgi:hypothetical protein
VSLQLSDDVPYHALKGGRVDLVKIRSFIPMADILSNIKLAGSIQPVGHVSWMYERLIRLEFYGKEFHGQMDLSL